jgi:hypothetical protein
MRIDLQELNDCLVEFSALRLKGAKVAWIKKGPLPSDFVDSCESDLPEAVLKKFAYAVPGRLLAGESKFISNESKVLLADRYGGAGLAGNGGGGRSGIIGNYQVKGIGQNPLVGKAADDWHAYGGLSLHDAVLEAINSEVYDHVLPVGTVGCYAIIITGSDTAHVPSSRYGETGPGGLLVREVCARPAHFFRADRFVARKSDNLKITDDVTRTRTVNVELLKRFGEHTKVIELVGNFLSASARQFAFARSFGIYHGALSPSNISFDGRWLDLTNISTVPSGVNFQDSKAADPYYSEMWRPLAIADEFLYTYTKYNRTEFSFQPLAEFYRASLEECQRRYLLERVGIPEAVVDEVVRSTDAIHLCNYLRQRLEENPSPSLAAPIYAGFDDCVVDPFEKLALSLEMGPSSCDEAAQTFRRTLEITHAALALPFPIGNFLARAAIKVLKVSYFAGLFLRKSLSDQVSSCLSGPGFAGIADLINAYGDGAQWIFESDDLRRTSIFKSGAILMLFDVNEGLYKCTNGLASNVSFSHPKEAMAWVHGQSPDIFTIGGCNFKDRLLRMLRVLEGILRGSHDSF